MGSLLLRCLLGVSSAAPDVAVVCPSEFRQALQPWITYRTAEGHRVEILSSHGSPQQIRQRIVAAAQPGSLRFVVLVGDAKPQASSPDTEHADDVPTFYAPAKVIARWGPDKLIATDAPYADLDGDGQPDLALGRLPVDTPEQLRKVIQKTLAYEQTPDFGLWRRRVNVVAGVGGFGPLIDTVLESATKNLLTEKVPAAYHVSMTQANWRSPYCPPPCGFREATLRRLNEGAWFWCYVGHGHPWRLDQLAMPDGHYAIFTDTDTAQLKCEHAAPIALLLACYTGAFDAQRDCLAERMLLESGGPVAAIAASRVTMPYAMTVLATSLMDECFQEHRPTLGESLLHAKRNMLRETDADDKRRAAVDTIALAISPAKNELPEQRKEHVQLFHLLGDPLLQMRYPKPVTLDVPTTATAGEPLRVLGVSPMAGRVTIELMSPRGRLSFKPPARREYPRDADARAEMQDTYDRAIADRVCEISGNIGTGRFLTLLPIPFDFRGPCHVRAYVEGKNGFAGGARELLVKRPAFPSPSDNLARAVRNPQDSSALNDPK